MRTIKELNIKGISLNFNMNNEYFLNGEIKDQGYKNYKIYLTKKGGKYINYKNKRYYLDFIF